MQSVQFRGVDTVLEAYQRREVAAWSIWQGKQYMFKYEGSDISEGANQLHEVLKMLSNATNAIYTLKVYEDLKKGAKIKSNTPDDGSFNFRLNMDTQEITMAQYTRTNNSNELLSRLTAIEAKLQADDEEEEEEPNRLGMIGHILEHPVLGQLAAGFLGKILAPAQQVPALAAGRIAGLPEATAQPTAPDLSNAVAVLLQHDPKLAEHLGKLAALATNNPQSFQFLLQTLDNM